MGHAEPDIRHLETASSGCEVKRRVRRVESGVLRLDQEIRITGEQRGLDVLGQYWMCAAVEVSRGSISYLRGNNLVRPESPFAIFAPPFSILEVTLAESASCSIALVSAQALPRDLPQESVIFERPPGRFPESIAEAIDLVRAAPQVTAVDRSVDPPMLARRIKKAIESSYRSGTTLSNTAATLRIAPATLSRCFRTAYGIPPVRYRGLLRTMDGMMGLLEGRAVADVAQEVGVSDLSRFYRHFRRDRLGPPAKYRFD